MSKHRTVFEEAARKLGMPRKEFMAKMEALVRRIDLMNQVKNGDARLRRVYVEPYEVRAYKVSGHYRYIEDKAFTKARRKARPALRVIDGGRS